MPRASRSRKTSPSPTPLLRKTQSLRAVSGSEDAYVDALDRLPDEFLDCRRSHLWKVIRDYHLVDCVEDADRHPRMGYTRYVEQMWLCTRCKMKRSDAFSLEQRGHRTALVKLGSSSYTPPEGFYIVGVPGGTGGRGELLRGLLYERSMERSQ